MKHLLALLITISPARAADPALPYTIVDTGQSQCYDNRAVIKPPATGQPFVGQDSQFTSHAASYTISADGLTTHDKQTGLTWQRSPETNGDGKLTHADKLIWQQALAQPAKLNAAKFGGFDDWRLPTIKELYSLFDARGTDPNPMATSAAGLVPFIDTKAFEFIYGDVANGSRIIDSQYGSATKYVGKSPRGGDKIFGVNFADGRIKGYDQSKPGGNREFRFFILCVRGNPQYGKNDFHDNKDGTVTDRATGLTWSKSDSGKAMNWQQALAWVQEMNAAKHLGHDDWRLPNVKELQSIVDYTRSPDTSNSPAIDPVLSCTQITNEDEKPDHPFYWSGTTHIGSHGGGAAMYVTFGRAAGFLSRPGSPGGPQAAKPQGPFNYVDIHGAGAQRSDPKSGDPKLFPHGRGPQGDVVRIGNFVRLVRGGSVDSSTASTSTRQEPATPPTPPATPQVPNRQRPAAPPIIGALDTNNDGVIDPTEIANSAAALKALDRNQDGKLSPEEYRPTEQARPNRTTR